MEFTEIWLRRSAPLVNGEQERAHKSCGIFNKHLIVFNIEQTIVITEIPDVNAPTVNRKKVGADGSSAPALASVYVNLGRDGGEERREEVGLICGLN